MPKRSSSEDERLTDEEIEAILAQDNVEVPENPATEHQIVRREPGEGKFGAWAVWLIIAFILLGALQTMR